jgi:hypothetical protein
MPRDFPETLAGRGDARWILNFILLFDESRVEEPLQLFEELGELVAVRLFNDASADVCELFAFCKSHWIVPPNEPSRGKCKGTPVERSMLSLST